MGGGVNGSGSSLTAHLLMNGAISLINAFIIENTWLRMIYCLQGKTSQHV